MASQSKAPFRIPVAAGAVTDAAEALPRHVADLKAAVAGRIENALRPNLLSCPDEPPGTRATGRAKRGLQSRCLVHGLDSSS
jgi:hypothetical protein